MLFTKEKIFKMREIPLQTEVLVPLFQVMGYQDVIVYQGPNEIGKDIVMWKPGDLEERVNYAVVVKAVRIDGKADGGHSSAARVAFQLEQAFSTPYLDSVTGQNQTVDRCFVVSNKEVMTTAIQNIKGVLESRNYNKITRFINGNELWELVDKYLGKRTALAKLPAIQETLDEASPHYRVIATTTGKISFKAKYPGAEKDHPIVLTGKVAFPNTPEGKEKLKEFEDHISTGRPITFSPEFVQEVKFPDFLEEYLDNSLNRKWSLSIDARRSKQSLPIKIKVLNQDGQEACLDYINLQLVQAGKDEMTLDNAKQSVPWKVTFIVNKTTRSIALTFDYELENINIKQADDCLHFVNTFARGGKLIVENFNTGQVFYTQPFDKGIVKAPTKERLRLVNNPRRKRRGIFRGFTRTV